jgi:orotate phosphoribosyltransferase (EC 2.4.2.10)
MIEKFVERGILKFGRFKLSSGLESPFYVDLRGVLGEADLFRWVMERYREAAAGLDFDVVVGVATGGIPYASVLGYLMGKPIGYVRPEAKGYGTGRQVEGADVTGRRVLVVDDVLTTGRSVSGALHAVRSAGGVATGVLVFLDREQCGAAEVKAEAGVEVYSVYKMRDVLEVVKPHIAEEHYRSAVEYLAQWRC